MPAIGGLDLALAYMFDRILHVAAPWADIVSQVFKAELLVHDSR